MQNVNKTQKENRSQLQQEPNKDLDVSERCIYISALCMYVVGKLKT